MGVAWLIGAFMLAMVADTSYLALAAACLVFGGRKCCQHVREPCARRHLGRGARRAGAEHQSAGFLACMRTPPFSTTAPVGRCSEWRQPAAAIVGRADRLDRPTRARHVRRQRPHPVHALRHARRDGGPAVGFHGNSDVRTGRVLRGRRLRDRDDHDEPRLDPGLDGGGAALAIVLPMLLGLVVGWLSFYHGSTPLYASVISLVFPIVVTQLVYSGGALTGSSSGLVGYDTLPLDSKASFA